MLYLLYGFIFNIYIYINRSKVYLQVILVSGVCIDVKVSIYTYICIYI